MKNWKTTLFGFLVALPHIAPQIGIPSVGHVGNVDVLTALGGLGALGLGWYAKDKNVTGGTTQNDGK